MMIKKHFSEDLPKFFYNFDTNAPFTHCLVCHESLDLKGVYAVEKVMKHNRVLNSDEIVFEYAMCMDCAEDLQSEISKESMQAIAALYEEYSLNLATKLEYLHETEKYSLESWLERCSFTGKEIRLCDEYQVSAIIEDGKLVYDHSPMVVSDVFIELLQERLSEKTKGFFNDFRDKHFDLDPDLKDLINGPTVGIL